MNNGEKGDDTDQSKPVFVGEFPQLVRDEQTRFSRNNNRHPGEHSLQLIETKGECVFLVF